MLTPPNSRCMCELKRARAHALFFFSTDQIYNPICSVCHDATTGKHPWFPRVSPCLLVICCHHTPAKQTASQQQKAQPNSYFPVGILLARIMWVFNIIDFPNPLKFVQHCKLPKKPTSRASYTTYQLNTSHYMAQIWLKILGSQFMKERSPPLRFG